MENTRHIGKYMTYKFIKPNILIQDTFYFPGAMFQVAKYMKYGKNTYTYIFTHSKQNEQPDLKTKIYLQQA